MSRIIVIGCASLDTIHVEKNHVRTTYETVGGAGLYTALAARAGGASVTLFAPKPDPMPEQLAFVENLIDWVGPGCHAKSLPRLEIVHHGGGKATLLNASWGAESLLRADQLPPLEDADCVHIAALSSARSQFEFLQICQRQQEIKISVGTYAKLIDREPVQVRELLDSSDFFFMNANEARALFKSGKPEDSNARKVVFVTDGENGATAYNGEQKFEVSTRKIVDLDPTGAGDTFCGATLAQILKGQNLENSIQIGCDLASSTVEQVGPKALVKLLNSTSAN
jgi:sugar/nucleoside kinase (ribokinase family)